MKSLSAILMDEPLEVLRTLACWWGAEVPEQDIRREDGREDDEVRLRLERAMRDSIASRFVWEQLGETERRVLFAVIGPSARNWVPVETLADRAHLDPADAEKGLARLVEQRLAFAETARVQAGDLVGQRAAFYGYVVPRNTQAPIEEKVIVYVPTELATGLYTTGRELFAPHADRSQMSLDELLMPYRQGDLDQIGRRFGLTLQAYYSRNEVRAAMAENLQQAEAVRYALARVEPRLRETYEWLRERDGRASVAALREHLHLSDPALSALLHSLEEYALAFDGFSEGERILFIPRETLANLRRAEVRPQAKVGLAQCGEPRAVQPGDTPFLWDLAVLVAASHSQEIELTRSGSLPKRAAQRVLPLLAGPRARRSDEEALGYVELLKAESQDLGLLATPSLSSRTRARLTPGAKLDSWARHDLVMQARRLLRRWPMDRWWTDLPGANYTEWMAFYLEAPIAREAVLELLRKCKPGVWYSLSSFRATIRGDDPYVLRPSQRYAGESGFKLADDLRTQWEHTDGELIAGIFRSTLYELGIVALGYDLDSVPSADDDVNPDAFMLTELGVEVLTSELSATQQPSSRAIVVQPNFQVLLMEPYMPGLYGLLRFATVEQMGRVSRFSLTRESLERALASGASVEEITSFLGKHAHKSLPQNVVYSLRDWARQYRERLMEPWTLVARDETAAREVVTAPQLRSFQLQNIGSLVSVPPEASLHELWHALERSGYLKVFSNIEDFVAAATGLPRRRRNSRPARPAVSGRIKGTSASSAVVSGG
ncbi:MAG TPA: helicase-associated domain-containing protein [Ktedonobacterales bacterium]